MIFGANENLAQVREKLRSNPNDPAALCKIAHYYLTEGQYKLAKDYYALAAKVSPHLFPRILLDYEKEIEKDPQRIGPRLSFAGYKILQGELDAAVLEMEEALEVDPRNIEIYNLLGKIFVKQEKIDETIALIEKSLKEGINDVSLTETLAFAYLERGKIKEAIRSYEEVLGHKNGDKQTLRTLGELYTRTEDYSRAAKYYYDMFSDDPEVVREVIQRLNGLLQKSEGNIFIRELLADIYLRSLKPDEAVTKLWEILKLDDVKLEEVAVRLRGILKSYPEHPQAMLALAEVLRRQNNYSEAAEIYHALVKNKPGFTEEAINGYLAVLKECPNQVLAKSYLAEAHLSLNQAPEALQEFEGILQYEPAAAEMVIKKCREILKVAPGMLKAHLVLGRAYLVKGDLERVVVEAEGVVALDKNYYPAYLILGGVYLEQKNYVKAVEFLQNALKLAPFNHEIMEKYKEAREKEAETKAQQLKEEMTGDQWKVSLHLELAKLYLSQGMKESSVHELQAAMKDRNRAPQACNLLGRIYRSDGRFDLAAAQFNRALELNAEESSEFAHILRFSLGTVYEAEGMVKKALKVYEGIYQEDADFGDLKRRIKYLKETNLQSMRDKMMVGVNTKFGTAEIIALWGRSRGRGREEVNISFGQNYNNSGFEYFMKGMYKAALEEFVLAVQLDAKFVAALNNLGMSYIKEGRLLEAKGKLEEAIQVEQNSAVLHNNLGLLLLLLGAEAQAKQELEKAYGLDPELSAVCINLGDIYYMEKNIEPAITLYKKVGSFDPLGDIAEQRLLYKVA